MGLSAYPTPSDSFLAFIVVNVPSYFFFIDRLLRSLLAVLFPPPPATLEPPASARGRFRGRVGAARFGSAAAGPQDGDCRVCLDGFHPGSPARMLPCGHIFHLYCLDTWLRFRRATCPLCRSNFLAGDRGLPAS